MAYNEGNQIADDGLPYEPFTVPVGIRPFEGSQCPSCGRRFANPPGSRLICYYHNTVSVGMEPDACGEPGCEHHYPEPGGCNIKAAPCHAACARHDGSPGRHHPLCKNLENP